MFKLQDDGEEKLIKNRTVIICIPGDGDAITKSEIKADFLLLPQDEVDNFIESVRDGDTDSDLLRKVWVGWNGVQGSDGNVLEFGAAARDRMLKISYVRTALLESYFLAASGKKAKRGN